jgi:hypothetical protein
MLKCQEAGKRQEMPILKFKQNNKHRFLKQCAPNRLPLSHELLLVRCSGWVPLLPCLLVSVYQLVPWCCFAMEHFIKCYE